MALLAALLKNSTLRTTLYSALRIKNFNVAKQKPEPEAAFTNP
jgi:hypothetical protein